MRLCQDCIISYSIILLCVPNHTFIVRVKIRREIAKIPIAGADPRLPIGVGERQPHIIWHFFPSDFVFVYLKAASASASLIIYRYLGDQPIIWPKFFRKLYDNGPVACPKFYYVNPPLVMTSGHQICVLFSGISLRI